MISSPDPIERLLEPGDAKAGYLEMKEDVKCLINVRAARTFPFWRYLKILWVIIFGGPVDNEQWDVRQHPVKGEET